MVTKIGEKAGVVVNREVKKVREKIIDPKTKKPTGRTKLVEREVIKYASAHDLHRSFGTRWAKRVMPATLKLLMRHSSIDTTMRYYVEMDSDEVAADLWVQHRSRTGQENAPSSQVISQSTRKVELSPMPSADSILSDTEFVAFDLETTGLFPVSCRIVEFGAVRFQLDGKELGRPQQIVDPQCQIPQSVTRIHGITNVMVEGKPTVRETLPRFASSAEFVGEFGLGEGTEIVIESGFVGFLGSESV